MRKPIGRAAAVLVCAIATFMLAGCGSEENLGKKWLPRLEAEVARTCQKDDCSDEVNARVIELTTELSKDADDADPKWAEVAELATLVNLAVTHWESDCYPSGSWSDSAGMSCDDAFTLTLRGPQMLLDKVRSVSSPIS